MTLTADDVVDDLRLLAAVLSEQIPAGGAYEFLDEAADELERLRAAPQTPQEARQCHKRAAGHPEPCDRPMGHQGRHSYELADLTRLRADYDAIAANLGAARRAATLAEADARRARADKAALEAWIDKRRWRLRLPGRQR